MANLIVAVIDRKPTDRYVEELLAHAGIGYTGVSVEEFKQQTLAGCRICLLTAGVSLTLELRQVVSGFVRGGGGLICVGGTMGLEEVLGVSGSRELADGYLRIRRLDHPAVSAFSSSLHVFGGCVAFAAEGTSLAEVEDRSGQLLGDAVVENRFGNGLALLIAPDLLYSIVHIQQGIPVSQDGAPAPDGSAPINDGILKCEDGLVLDWERDRQPMSDGVRIFAQPIADELRELIVKSLLHLIGQQNLALPMVWYWPKGHEAVGLISHDTDGNNPDFAWKMLHHLEQMGLKTTWCIIYPGGYPKEFYEALKLKGCEIALHYDAQGEQEHSTWSRENLDFQLNWLLKEADVSELVSNKNHYTRWEGRLDFFRWCADSCIHAEQSKGPSKRGTLGFPFGGSHPWLPLDDESPTSKFLNVLEINLFTQDIVKLPDGVEETSEEATGYFFHPAICPNSYARALMDATRRHHGVAHFLFHPAHIEKPGVADALRDVVEYGRALGLDWLTSELIYRWEAKRRQVRQTVLACSPGGLEVLIESAQPLTDVMLLVFLPKDWKDESNYSPHLIPQPPSSLRSGEEKGEVGRGEVKITLNGQSVSWEVRQVYGLPAVAIPLGDGHVARVKIKR